MKGAVSVKIRVVKIGSFKNKFLQIPHLKLPSQISWPLCDYRHSTLELIANKCLLNTIGDKMISQRASFLTFLVILLFTGGCNVFDTCESKQVLVNDFFIISPEGELLDRYRLGGKEASPESPELSRNLSLFGDNLVLNIDYDMRIIDYTTGETVFSANTNSEKVSTSLSSNQFIYVKFERDNLIILDDIELNRSKTIASIISNKVERNSNTSDTLVKIEGKKLDREKYEAVDIVAHDLSEDSETLYYIQKNRLVKVTTDSSKTHVFQNLFYYERSLWKYDLNTEESKKLFILSNTELHSDYFLLSISPDEQSAAYIDREGLYLINLPQKSFEFKEGRFNKPDFSDDNRFLVLEEGGCGFFTVMDLETGEEWVSFGSHSMCDYVQGYSILPGKHEAVYVSEVDYIPRIRKANFQNRYSDEDDESDEDEVIFEVLDYIDIKEEVSYGLTVSSLIAMPDGNILFHVNFKGKDRFCN